MYKMKFYDINETINIENSGTAKQTPIKTQLYQNISILISFHFSHASMINYKKVFY